MCFPIFQRSMLDNGKNSEQYNIINNADRFNKSPTQYKMPTVFDSFELIVLVHVIQCHWKPCTGVDLNKL